MRRFPSAILAVVIWANPVLAQEQPPKTEQQLCDELIMKTNQLQLCGEMLISMRAFVLKMEFENTTYYGLITQWKVQGAKEAFDKNHKELTDKDAVLVDALDNLGDRIDSNKKIVADWKAGIQPQFGTPREALETGILLSGVFYDFEVKGMENYIMYMDDRQMKNRAIITENYTPPPPPPPPMP